MSDRELLQMAAKAAGLRGVAVENFEGPAEFRVIPGDGSFSSWNPLQDDGDALRLAVKLRINIEHQTTMGGKPVGFNVWPVGRGDCGSIEDASDEAALRRAIVRAAAAIGATQDTGAAS